MKNIVRVSKHSIYLLSTPKKYKNALLNRFTRKQAVKKLLMIPNNMLCYLQPDRSRFTSSEEVLTKKKGVSFLDDLQKKFSSLVL